MSRKHLNSESEVRIMPLSHTIEFVALEQLSLDPRNPRLGLGDAEPLATQERVLELMRGWNLEELAVSFLENGFWPQEAVFVVKKSCTTSLKCL